MPSPPRSRRIRAGRDKDPFCVRRVDRQGISHPPPRPRSRQDFLPQERPFSFPKPRRPAPAHRCARSRKPPRWFPPRPARGFGGGGPSPPCWFAAPPQGRSGRRSRPAVRRSRSTPDGTNPDDTPHGVDIRSLAKSGAGKNPHPSPAGAARTCGRQSGSGN